MSTFPWLTVIGAIPLVGALAVALTPGQSAPGGEADRRARARLVKQLTLGFTLVTLALTALVSLIVFGAAGWSLRRLQLDRPQRPTAQSPVAASDVNESQSLSQGRLTYQVHCARCHGAEGRGDGSDGKLVNKFWIDTGAAH